MTSFNKILACIMLAILFAVSCTKPDEPNNDGNGGNNDTLIFTPEYVDLGLPSGTLWATCNVGAEVPEGRGDYFAWGETQPKDTYNWGTYQHCNGNYNLLTKYCVKSSCGLNGFADSLTVLEPADDVATTCWGADWRMPTKEEWDELYRKTTVTTTAQNGVEGRLLTGVNGNSIFLPATGFCLEEEMICLGLGVYWTSSVHTDYPERAWSFHYDLDECHVCGTYERSRGHVVRAVRKMN